MFNIGAAELILILLIAFLVVGPKDLPKVARAVGRFVRYIRAIIEEVKKETGFDEISEEFKSTERDIKQTMESVDVRKDLQKTQLEINKGLKDVNKELSFKEFKNNMNNNMGGQ